MEVKSTNKLDENKIKELIELAKKTPALVKLRQDCEEIGWGRRKEISRKVIEDAFDAFGVIVKKLSTTTEEELELQKLSVIYLFHELLYSNHIEIKD